MTQQEVKNETQETEVQLSGTEHKLDDDLRKQIHTSTVHENFQLAAKVREDLRDHLGKAQLDGGAYDFSKVEGMSEDEAYNHAQQLQAVFLEIVQANNRKLRSAEFSATSRADIPGAPPIAAIEALYDGTAAPNDMFERFKQLHGLDTSKIFERNAEFYAEKATIDDFQMNSIAGGSNSGAVGNGPDAYGTFGAPTDDANIRTWPTAGGPGVAGTPTAGVNRYAPGYSTTGVPVNRYLSQIPAQMHYRRRDFLTPMIMRIPCPPMTETLRYISEEMATGAPGASNKVRGRGEGERALLQNISTREISVTVIKRAVAATITDEQIKDTVQGRQIANQNMMIKIQEDYEDQAINGDGVQAHNNMEGIFTRAALPSGATTPETLDASSSYFKQVFSRVSGEARTPIDFMLDALTQYLKPRPEHSNSLTISDEFGAGRSPTHIVLPMAEKMRLMGVKDNQGRYLWANTVEGDFISLWGLPIIISDYCPVEKGLILALDEIAIVVKEGVEWKFGMKDDDLLRGQTTMVATHRANVLCKRPRTVMILENLAAK